MRCEVKAEAVQAVEISFMSSPMLSVPPRPVFGMPMGSSCKNPARQDRNRAPKLKSQSGRRVLHRVLSPSI